MKKLFIIAIFMLALGTIGMNDGITPDGFDDDHFPEYVTVGITPDGFDDDHFPEYVTV